MYKNSRLCPGSQTIEIDPPDTILQSTMINDKILFYIVTGNLQELKKYININNINNIIDKKNNYSALHYAVKLPNNEIVEYLLNLGASITLKQNEDKDSIDLSIESNKRFLINKILKKNETELDHLYEKYDNVNYKTKILEKENIELKNTNEYLNKLNITCIKKTDEIKKDNIKLMEINENFKTSNNYNIKTISEYREENNKLKRKIDIDETSICNLVTKLKDSETAFINLVTKAHKK